MEMVKIQKKVVKAKAVQYDGTPKATIDFIKMVLENGGVATLECTSSPCSGANSEHQLKLHTSTGVKPVFSTNWVFLSDASEWFILTDDVVNDGYEFI